MHKIAIIGATGIVGREIIKILWERKFPVEKIFPLASFRSVGKKLKYGDDHDLIVQDLKTFDFAQVDLAFFTAGANVSSLYVPHAAKTCMVIDNTSYFRMKSDVPLVVPEVNPETIKLAKKNIIANPNCSTIQMVVVLKPLHDRFGIKRVVVSTYQATSGAGAKAKEELLQQAKNESASIKTLSKKIAFNVIPQIDQFLDDGATKEEWKMEVESNKILDAKIKIHANCARIGSLNGHAEYINIETIKPISVEEAKNILRHSPGIKVVDDESYVTPIDASGKDEIFVSRMRRDNSVENGLSFWCVADNIRKGAALNSVQIAELLAESYPDT
jgi:aspartate-semialdehyde dehydrogenase